MYILQSVLDRYLTHGITQKKQIQIGRKVSVALI